MADMKGKVPNDILKLMLGDEKTIDSGGGPQKTKKGKPAKERPIQKRTLMMRSRKDAGPRRNPRGNPQANSLIDQLMMGVGELPDVNNRVLQSMGEGPSDEEILSMGKEEYLSDGHGPQRPVVAIPPGMGEDEMPSTDVVDYQSGTRPSPNADPNFNTPRSYDMEPRSINRPPSGIGPQTPHVAPGTYDRVAPEAVSGTDGPPGRNLAKGGVAAPPDDNYNEAPVPEEVLEKAFMLYTQRYGKEPETDSELAEAEAMALAEEEQAPAGPSPEDLILQKIMGK